MRDTFFVPSFGNRPKSLVGREDVINEFRLSLQSEPGSRERAMLLLGQRGYGKTVLLHEFADIAKDAGFIVASPTIVSKDMPLRIIEKLKAYGKEFLHNPTKKLTGGNISILGFGAGVQLQNSDDDRKSFASQLSDICKIFNEKNKPVCILIDEVQGNNEELRQLIIAYQEMVGEGRNISIVFAGLPSAVSSVLNDHVLTFLNRALKKELPPLKTNEIAFYYKKVLTESGLSVDDDIVKKAAEETQGSPYLMQLIGHYLVLNSETGMNIGLKTLDKAVKAAKEDFKNDICKTTLASLSERDIEFLTAMSSFGSECSMTDITGILNCTGAFAQTYKRRLIHAGVIDQPRRGMIRFAVPYLQSYLSEQNS